MISYIQVLDVFKTFAQGHLQIQKFDFEFREQMPNLATVDEAYPMLFVVPVGGSTLENVREFDIDVYCVDRYQKDRSNVNYVISDTDLILGDLTRWLEEGQNDIEVVRTYTTTPINNDLLDYVGGHVMRMRVQVDRIALCEIPFDGEAPVPPTCPSAIVRNSDGSWSDIVPSGGTYIVPDTPVTVTDTDGNTLDTVDVVSVTGGAVVAPDASYLVEYENGTPIQSGTILSGGSETIQVPNQPVCEDATVENSDQSFQESIPSGGVEVLEDYEFEFQDPNGNVLNTEFTPAMINDTFIVGAAGSCPTVFPFDVYVNGVFQSTQDVDIANNINITIE